MNSCTYTGKNGFYSQVTPLDPVALKQIDVLVYHTTGLTLSEQDAGDIGRHVTVMYSKASLKVDPAIVAEWSSRRFNDLPSFEASVHNFDYWDGHDNEGYFVAALKSDELDKLHAFWKDMGAEPTFEEYKAHMTLAKGPKARELRKFIPQLSASLFARGGFSLTLGNMKVDDLK